VLDGCLQIDAIATHTSRQVAAQAS
jgi:hypothetical protein